MSTQIEEAVVVEENCSTTVLTVVAAEALPALPEIFDKEEAIEIIREHFEKFNVEIKTPADVKTIKAGQKILRDSRLAWVKSIKENLHGPAKAWLDKLKSDYEAVEAEFKAKELIFKERNDAWEKKKLEEKQAEENRKTLLLGQRIEKIVSLGGKSDGTQYLFSYDLTLSSNIALLKEMTEETWNAHVEEIQASFTAEEARIASEKEESEQAAKKVLLQSASLNEKRTNIRLKELLKLEGFTGDADNGYVNERLFVITHEQVLTIEDEEWEDLILLANAEPVKEEPKAAAPVQSTQGGAIGWGGGAPKSTPAPVEIPKEEVKPAAVDLSSDDDDEFPWLAEEKTESMMKVADKMEASLEEPKVSADLGIKQRMLNFSKVTPFISFEIGGNFLMRIFPAEDAVSVCGDVDSDFIAASGSVNETLSFALIKK